MDPIQASDLALADGIELMAGWQTHHRTDRSPELLMTAGASKNPSVRKLHSSTGDTSRPCPEDVKATECRSRRN